MSEIIKQPWPWYVSGAIIGLTVPLLLILGDKKFGVSSTLRQICAICIPARIPFFQYDWKKDSWNLYFVVGIFIGGFLSGQFFYNDLPLTLAASTIKDLQELGIKDFSGVMPSDLFSLSQLLTVRGLTFTVLGGFLVGFGTRYAGGCTSGHSIMGLSNLQWPSLIATICFMTGGIIVTHFLLPFLLAL